MPRAKPPIRFSRKFYAPSRRPPPEIRNKRQRMPEPLIDQKFLERLERLTLHWQKSFLGLVGGHNASRYPGSGQEFLDHRGFHHGDDLRAVNWRAYMRLEKLIL